jgi:propionyl-CoA carboxylase alpha chain
MNTRLQVEHPVTEEVTGLDLVEQMIRVAAGEKLSFSQEDVKLNGWAIESRVYAEDPYRGFLPSTGRLTTYQPPREQRDADRCVRVDDGVVEGGEVSMFYDPMIAKLISWAPNREGAIDAQVEALDSFQVGGISDNIDFLSALLQHPRFRSGALTTGFIAEEYPEGFHGDPEFPDPVQVVRIAKRDYEVSVDPYDGGTLVTVDGGADMDVIGDWAPGQPLLVVDVDDRRRVVQVARRGRDWLLTTRGAAHNVAVMPRHVAQLTRHMIEKVAPDMSRFLLAPMPGLLTRLEVAVGDKVEAGQPVAVVEAMKMENILRAAKSSTVKSVSAGVGESLAVDQVIVEFE